MCILLLFIHISFDTHTSKMTQISYNSSTSVDESPMARGASHTSSKIPILLRKIPGVTNFTNIQAFYHDPARLGLALEGLDVEWLGERHDVPDFLTQETIQMTSVLRFTGRALVRPGDSSKSRPGTRGKTSMAVPGLMATLLEDKLPEHSYATSSSAKVQVDITLGNDWWLALAS